MSEIFKAMKQEFIKSLSGTKVMLSMENAGSGIELIVTTTVPIMTGNKKKLKKNRKKTVTIDAKNI